MTSSQWPPPRPQEQWRAPEWHLAPAGWPGTVPVQEPALDVRRDLGTMAAIVLGLFLAAPVVGLIWASLAPTLSASLIRGIANGSEAPFRVFIGADVWFLGVTAVAGAMTAAIVHRLAPGPGAVAGLAAGGIVAALVADRVGYLAQRGPTNQLLTQLGITHSHAVHDLLDFHVRATGVLVAWPLAAITVYFLLVATRSTRET